MKFQLSIFLSSLKRMREMFPYSHGVNYIFGYEIYVN